MNAGLDGAECFADRGASTNGQRLFGLFGTGGVGDSGVAQDVQRPALARADCFLCLADVGAAVVRLDDVGSCALPGHFEVYFAQSVRDGVAPGWVDPAQDLEVVALDFTGAELNVAPITTAGLFVGCGWGPDRQKDTRWAGRATRGRLAEARTDPPGEPQDALGFALAHGAVDEASQLLADEGAGFALTLVEQVLVSGGQSVGVGVRWCPQ